MAAANSSTSESIPVTPAAPGGRRAFSGDRVYAGALAAAGIAILLVALLIAATTANTARPALARAGLWGFITGRDWNPVEDIYGALPFIWGTLVTSVVAIVLAVPVAVAFAIFLVEFAPSRSRSLLRFVMELLASIPSVVYGLWGLFVLVPLLREHVEPALGRFSFLPLFRGAPLGVGTLAAGVLLAIMILPTIASVSVEVLRTVPSTLREGALALGATRWEAVRIAALPYGRAGIFGAALLGLGRALGETMAATMVIGNSPEISASLFAPGYSLPSIIANEFSEATSALHIGALAALGLILFVVALILNIAARLLVRAVVGKFERSSS